jgi:hypothetical protein
MDKKQGIISAAISILVPLAAEAVLVLMSFVKVGFDLSTIRQADFWYDKVINFSILYVVYTVILASQIYNKKVIQSGDIESNYGKALINFREMYKQVQSETLYMFGLRRYCDFEYKERIQNFIDDNLSKAEVSTAVYNERYKNNNSAILKDKDLTRVQKRFLINANKYIKIQKEDVGRVIHDTKQRAIITAIQDHRAPVLVKATVKRLFYTFIVATAVSAMVLNDTLEGSAISIILDILIKGATVAFQVWSAFRTCTKYMDAECDYKNSNTDFFVNYLVWVKNKDLSKMKTEYEFSITQKEETCIKIEEPKKETPKLEAKNGILLPNSAQ